MGFGHGSLRHLSWHQNIVKQAFWVPWSFLRVELWVFYGLHKYSNAGSGLPQGLFLENNLLPVKVGLRWVFGQYPEMGSKKGVRKWVFACKCGHKCVKTHFLPHSGHWKAYPNPPILAFFGKKSNDAPKKARISLSAEPFKIPGKKGSTHKKARKNAKRKKARKTKRARIGGSG